MVKDVKHILKRLARNKKRLEKQAATIDKLFADLDKKTFELLLTLKQ